MIKFKDILIEIGAIKDPKISGGKLSYVGKDVGEEYKFTVNDKKVELNIYEDTAYSLEILDKIYNTKYYEKYVDTEESNRDEYINKLKLPKTISLSFTVDNESRTKKEQRKDKMLNIEYQYKNWQKMWDDIRKEGFKTPEEAWEKYVNNVNGIPDEPEGSPRSIYKNNPSKNMKSILNTVYYSIIAQQNKTYQEWLQNIKDKPNGKTRYKDETKDYLEILANVTGIISKYIKNKNPDVVIINFQQDGYGVNNSDTMKRNNVYEKYLKKYKPSNYNVKIKDDILYLEKN